jgi:hypothetical protein
MDARLDGSGPRKTDALVDEAWLLGEHIASYCQSGIDARWAMSSIPDRVYPGTRGQRPEKLQQMLEYQFAFCTTQPHVTPRYTSFMSKRFTS